MTKKVKPQLRIRSKRAYGNEAEQSWYFLGYSEEYNSYEERWVIVRRFCRNGDVWWGVKHNTETHEKGIDGIAEEMKLAKQAIKILKEIGKNY